MSAVVEDRVGTCNAYVVLSDKRAEQLLGILVWGVFSDPAPFTGEARRGYEAGLSARGRA